MQADMKNRFVELLKDTFHEWECEIQPETVLQIADHLIENDVIVPSCKVGDTVYCIATVNDALHPTFSWRCCEKYRIVKCTCKSIDVKLSNYVKYIQIFCTEKTEDSKFPQFSFLLKPEDFGTSAFLSEEEAKEMLYDMPEVKCGEWTIDNGSVYSMCLRKEDKEK